MGLTGVISKGVGLVLIVGLGEWAWWIRGWFWVLFVLDWIEKGLFGLSNNITRTNIVISENQRTNSAKFYNVTQGTIPANL